MTIRRVQTLGVLAAAGLIAGLVASLVAGLALSGCAGLRSHQRATNMEVRILSQSCFFGEIVPCG